MARTVKKLEIVDIRGTPEKPGFTSRGNYTNWLPSVVDPDKTFTLKGKDLNGDPSEKSVWTTINFGSAINKPDLEKNLQKFYLAMYCLRHGNYAFNGINDVLNYNVDDNLYTNSVEKFLKDFQMGRGPALYTKGLTVENVKTYRGTKGAPVGNLDEKNVDQIINYSRNTGNKYDINVASALGKVTYDAIVKNTLFHLLKSNELIPNIKLKNLSWVDEALKLEPSGIDYYIDDLGGPYYRAFPVVCVYLREKTGLSKDDILNKTNTLLTSKFFRNVTNNELVSEIISNVTDKPVGGDKNFIEIKNSVGPEYSIYCAIYDFTKIFVKDPASSEDATLGILKIALSLLSRSVISFNAGVNDIPDRIKQIRDFLLAKFGDSLEESDYKIAYVNKHSQEVAYSLSKEITSVKPKISNSFKIQLDKIIKTLEDSYDKIRSLINEQIKPGDKQNFQFINYPQNYEPKISLHFDNFFNLLAITAQKPQGVQQKKQYPQDVPFILEEYEISFKGDDLVAQFYKNQETLKNYPPNKPVYSYSNEIALTQDIALITDVFLRQVYENLDDQGIGLVYESKENVAKDQALNDITKGQISLLNEIKNRIETKSAEKIKKKEDYFYVSSNKIYLKKEVVKKLEIDDITFLFESVQENKIKFQTINHLWHVNVPELINKSLTEEDFTTRIYYPVLGEISNPRPRENPKSTPKTKKVTSKDKNDLLINNIISSQLACYEDISNSFDKAINSEKPSDVIYYLSQTLANIGLPILLAYASQQMAEKIANLGKSKDPSVLECLLNDSDKLKKFVLGYSDLFANSDPLSVLMQAVPELPRIPPIPFLFTFDAEKELKRKLVKYLIDQIVELIKKQLGYSIQPLLDMCNSDSYLNSLLSSLDIKKDKKLGSPSASGLPSARVGAAGKSRIPFNINELIDKSDIETRENVYENFRITFISEEEYNSYNNSSISEFFDFLSETIDAGEMVMLLKGTSSKETRSNILTYIFDYKFDQEKQRGKYHVIFQDSQSISYLFLFLGQYIDYRILLELIANSLENFTPTVCIDINSTLENIEPEFSKEEIDDIKAELSKTLDEICASKFPLQADILSSGPALLTKKLNKYLTSAMESVIDGVSSLFIVPNESLDSLTDSEEIKNIRNSYDIKSIYNWTENDKPSEIIEVPSAFYTAITKVKGDNILLSNIEKVFSIQKPSSNGGDDIFVDLIKITNKSTSFKDLKEEFKKQLLSSGNIGLKTEEQALLSYGERYRELLEKNIKIDF